MECTFENPSTVSLPTLTYAPVQTRDPGEPEREKENAPPRPVSLRPDPPSPLSFNPDSITEHNKQTPPRNLFSYVRGICQSTPLSPPSGFRSFSFSDSFTFSPSTVARELRAYSARGLPRNEDVFHSTDGCDDENQVDDARVTN